MGGAVDNPDDAQLQRDAMKCVLAGAHTSIPGRILSYTHGKKPRATVRPVIRFSHSDPDTEERVTTLAESVSNVPVLFPNSTNHSDTWPLEPGDPVLLIIAERSLDEWLATNNQDNAPQDPRRFDLTDAIALPVLGAGELPDDAFDATKRVIRGPMMLGSANATDFVALASLVNGIISTLDTVIRVGWVVLPTDGGAALKAAYLAAFPTPPSSVAATKVEAE